MFPSQQEDLSALYALVADRLAPGELERTFDPAIEVTTTVAGTGRVIGGTGGFAGALGRLVEHDTVHFFSLLTGTLIVRNKLEVVFTH